MSSHAVIGLGFGDEGKGVVTDFLCSRDRDNAVVVRFSGGHQCGHKVVREDGTEHIFSNFGSGTFRGCPTYWSKYCTFEPVGFWKEYSLLRQEGFIPSITIHPACPVTTIYDVYANRNSVEVEHGTTGTGFFRTKKRHLQDNLTFTVAQCLQSSWDVVMNKLDRISDYYGFEERLNIGPFVEACFEVRHLLGRGVRVGDLRPHPYMVFEGSQGLLLDQAIGTFPHVTPSDVTPHNAQQLIGELDEIYLVTRVYQTRHGNGPMTNTDRPVQLVNTECETNKHNKYQGEFRTAVLDLDQLWYAKSMGIDKVVSPPTRVNLVMTCADQMTTYFVSTGKELKGFTDVDEFVKFIGKELEIIGSLYVNTSPLSSTIREVKG